jgi:CubicO group peptidase (beta-lactamase class C family)
VSGFSLGCGVNVDVVKNSLPGSLGQYFWAGVTGSSFWIDPKEELAVIFVAQVLFSKASETLRRDLRSLVYSAMTESFA